MPRLEPLRNPPIGFAHRGGRAHRQENTLEAFSNALELGATGLETDAWVTADGEVVLDHDGVLRRFCVLRTAVAKVERKRLPSHVPTLGDLYAACGTDYELAVDVKDAAAFEGVVQSAAAAGAAERLWVFSSVSVETLAEWQQRHPVVRVGHSVRLGRLRGGPERHAATLAEAGLSAINMPHADWSGGLTTLFHRFEIPAFGWDAHHTRQLDELLEMGIDAVFSDHVDRMVDALTRWYPT